MFIDEIKIFVKSGDGGDGAVSFRREKFVPRGGPDGGDGGDGGSVIIKVDRGLDTLSHLGKKRHYRAQRGGNGRGKNRDGRDGEDVIIYVPPGTIVRRAESQELVADLTEPAEEVVVARGGKGGRGNTHFATSVNHAPRFAEQGEAGEEFWIELELKILAEVGLVGYPNAGKSTLLSRLSSAHPRIADYPFTTLIPNLGVVYPKEDGNFTIADMPGLIKGAHEGVGLGYQFLRHIERTRVIVYIIDISGREGRDPLQDFYNLYEELKLYNPGLLERPQLVIANKMDLPESKDNYERVRKKLEAQDYQVFPLSALNGEGVGELASAIVDILKKLPLRKKKEIPERVTRMHKISPPFIIIKEREGSYIVSGHRIERLLAELNLDRDEDLRRFHLSVERMGLIDSLRSEGAKDGDLIRIGDLEFDYKE